MWNLSEDPKWKRETLRSGIATRDRNGQVELMIKVERVCTGARSLSRANGSSFVVDQFSRGWRLMKKREELNTFSE